MNENVSPRQEKILDYINKKIKESGYPPSIREIAKAVNLSSSATVHSHLKKLEKKGYLKRNQSKPRAISVLTRHGDETAAGGFNNMIYIPVVGKIAAGKPILAEENIEDYFPLTPDFVKGKKEVFILHVRGDSMVNAGILDRDYIVVRKQENAINGEIIVALLEDEATVKRFFKTDKKIKLMPENDYMEPIVVKDVKIIGKVIGVIRKYF
ncbi:MAG: repressor LexA [Actinobacteria bacterium RBG_19FT_COMBO_36_27]|nr:MAG: repressor LexA [Actinobacteria bacterium RBG_19FT_COMBO_36_27]